MPLGYVWERKDGQRFVVDRHQRLALAKSTSKGCQHIASLPAEKAPGQAKTTQRNQQKGKPRTAPTKRQASSRRSDFTPGKIRRFERLISRARR